MDHPVDYYEGLGEVVARLLPVERAVRRVEARVATALVADEAPTLQ